MNKDTKYYVNYFYEEYKKYGSEDLYNCLIASLSKYLTSLNIDNHRTDEYYQISFNIDNREHLLSYDYFDKGFVIFDKYRNYHFDNENKLFEFIENRLMKEEANNEKNNIVKKRK